MWVFRKDIFRTIAIKDSEFNLIHNVVDGWQNTDFPDHLLFEANGVSYIAADVNNSKLGFNNTVLAKIPNKEFFQLRFNGSQWIRYTHNKNETWKKSEGITRDGNWFADLSDDKLKPFDIESGSELITREKVFERQGSELYKSNTLLGNYIWQGLGLRDDIFVGKRKYKHILEDDDFFAVESVELILISGGWSYDFNGLEYTFDSSDLPLGNFTMTSGDESINMIFIEIITVIKNVMHYDGGAQIVD